MGPWLGRPKCTMCIRDLDLSLIKEARWIHGSLFTNYEVSSIFWGSWGSIKNWLKPKINPLNQVKLVQIHDTHIRCRSDQRLNKQQNCLQHETIQCRILPRFASSSKLVSNSSFFFCSPSSTWKWVTPFWSNKKV